MILAATRNTQKFCDCVLVDSIPWRVLLCLTWFPSFDVRYGFLDCIKLDAAGNVFFNRVEHEVEVIQGRLANLGRAPAVRLGGKDLVQLAKTQGVAGGFASGPVGFFCT